MSEDMTYAPVETLAAARQRIAELEARLELVDEYAEYYSVAISLFAVTGDLPMSFDEWLADAQPDDDTDAPLTLAAIEDGDE